MSSSLRLLRSLGQTYRVASRSLLGTRQATSGLVRHNSSTRERHITGGSYDGPGKSTVDILNDESTLIMVNSYSANGFRLNNGMKVYGPIAVFPTCVLAWKVPGPLEITAESLSLFALIHPRPEVVFVGYGQRGAKFNEKAAMALTSSPCNFQFMATEDAISAYNYLSVEGRLVGAALIPPDTVKRLRESDYEDTTAKQRDTKFWDMEGGGDPFGDDYTGGDGTKNKKGW